MAPKTDLGKLAHYYGYELRLEHDPQFEGDTNPAAPHPWSVVGHPTGSNDADVIGSGNSADEAIEDARTALRRSERQGGNQDERLAEEM